MHAGNFSIANDLLLLCLTGALGLALGSLRIKGFSLGIAGVLFSGLFFGQLGLSISPQIAHFIREFGLILFVYTIGLQVGPGFFSSLKHRGLLLNLLATAIVLLGTSLVIFTFYSLRFDIGEITGIFSGATTNTPSLGAAQEAIQRSPTAQNSTPPALAYAICYPFGVLGILLSMLILKRVGKKEISAEEQKFLEEQEKENPPVSDLTLLVTNPNVVGKNLDELPGMSNSGIVISRLRREGQIRVARPDDRFQVGDVILAIGPSAALESLRIIVGTPVPDDLRSSAPGVSVRRIIVTRREAIGQTLQNLGLELKYQVTFTRLLRGEVELPAPTRLRLHAGDILTVVGSEADLDQVAR
ncbi:MAG: hypothetical protein NZL93_06785, partial [Chthoniobacterales bacterium]|nr:hypothetical protein [Chthoniobacterales bacterium]